MPLPSQARRKKPRRLHELSGAPERHTCPTREIVKHTNSHTARLTPRQAAARTVDPELVRHYVPTMHTHRNTLVSAISLGLALVGAAGVHSARAETPAGAEFFPILPWDPQHGWKQPHVDRKNGLASIAECDFTMAGFVQPQDLPLCEKLGLAAIMAPPDGEAPWAGKWRNLSDEQIDSAIKTQVERAGNSKAVFGYFIMDEPGTPAFPALAKAVAAVKKYAPGKLAYINLFPGYATIGSPDLSQLGAASFTEYLERFVTEVKPQFISYDNYMVQFSDDGQRPQEMAKYFADLLEVRRIAMKHNLPFWNIVSSNQIRPATTIPSPANLMFQAYTTLAAGGRGLSWYTYYGGGYAYAPVDKAGDRTATWSYLQMVNRQIRTLGPMMNRLKSTGVYFTSPPPNKSLPGLPGRLIRDVQSKASPRGFSNMYPPLMIGEFADEDGGDYVMIVNLSLERSTNVSVQTGKEFKSKQAISAADGRTVPIDEKNGLWLVPGQGVLIRLSQNRE